MIELADLKDKNNAANNAVNRKKTVLKNLIQDYLQSVGAKANDGIVLDDTEIAFRPNITDEIDPRTWYDWWKKGRISDNQFFSAISVSVTTARNAIGEDQLGEVKHTTLSKTPDLRIKPLEGNDYNDGVTIKFLGEDVKTAKVARSRPTDNSGKALDKTGNKTTKKVRKIRLSS